MPGPRRRESVEWVAHAAAKTTEAAAPEAAEASTAATRRVAGMPARGYEPTREAAMAAFEGISSSAAIQSARAVFPQAAFLCGRRPLLSEEPQIAK